MSAPVLAFDATSSPSDRLACYRRDVKNAYQALTQAIEQCGVKRADADRLSDAVSAAEYRHVRHWQHRAETAERSLRRVLDFDLSDEARDYVTAIVEGKTLRKVLKRPTSNAEMRMLEQYRGFDDATRQMIRTLFEVAGRAMTGGQQTFEEKGRSE